MSWGLKVPFNSSEVLRRIDGTKDGALFYVIFRKTGPSMVIQGEAA